jgi:hypothetical protein
LLLALEGSGKRITVFTTAITTIYNDFGLKTTTDSSSSTIDHSISLFFDNPLMRFAQRPDGFSQSIDTGICAFCQAFVDWRAIHSVQPRG